MLAFGMFALLHVRGLAGRDPHLPQLLLGRRLQQGIILRDHPLMTSYILPHYASLKYNVERKPFTNSPEVCDVI